MLIENKEERLMVLCDCRDLEHQIHFTYDPEPDDQDYLYIEYYLAKKSFFRRLKNGIKYIFGYTSKTGAFGETVVHPNQAKKIINHLEGYIKANE